MSPEHKILQIRLFDREKDYPMIAEWYRGHGQEPTPLAILPLLGVIVFEQEGTTTRDIGAIWLYMDNSIGVCFAEKVVTLPGLTMKEAKEALLFAVDFLKTRAAELDYGVMVIHAYPATARVLKTAGFHEAEKDMICMWTSTREVNNG